MKFLLMAASLRQQSLNKKLLQVAAEQVKTLGSEVNKVELADFTMPLYDGDINETAGLPAAAKHFISHLQANDGLILATPEYNFSIPGILKNLIDWVSRSTPMPWANVPILLLSASPALAGGHRGLWQTRIPLEGCGAYVFPDMFALATAHQAFTEQGQLKDPALQTRLNQVIANFLNFTQALQHLAQQPKGK